MSMEKLKALCYYCQGWSMAWDSKELFKDDFYTMRTGISCQKLRKSVIKEDIREKNPDELTEKDLLGYLEPDDLEGGSADKLTDNQKDTIDKVCMYYGRFDSQKLNKMIMSSKPWKDAAEKNSGHSKISRKSMNVYYTELYRGARENAETLFQKRQRGC